MAEQTKDNTVKILVVDDHEVVRKGLAQLIEQESDLEVCCGAANAEEAIDYLANCPADLVIMDLAIGSMTGIQLTEKLKVLYPEIRVLILTICEDLAYVKRAFRAGASGYVFKDEASEVIIRAIRDVMSGRMHVSRAVAEKIIEAKTSR
jgi:DNA-binding NarL/FixJ family response regulator